MPAYTHLTAHSNVSFAYKRPPNASKHYCCIQMPPKPQQSRAYITPSLSISASPRSRSRHATHSSLPPPQPQRPRRATSPLPENPEGDTSSSGSNIDWTLVSNAHDSLDLDISFCWNCDAPLHAASLFECSECFLPN
jgi:hypothetical protein